MRIVLALVLALAALAPVAAASPTSLDVEIEAPPAVKPLADSVEANVTIHVPCAYAQDPSAHATLKVASAPAWSRVVLDPATLTPHGESCGTDGKVVFHALLSAQATDQAPADAPAKLAIAIDATGAPGTVSGSGETSLTARWFSLIDTQLRETTKHGKPGETVLFPIKLTNLGNGATTLAFKLDAPQTIAVEPIAEIRLGSKQQGESNVSGDVAIVVHLPRATGYVNRVDVVNLRITSAYASDPSQAGETSTVSVLVATKGIGVGGAPSPAPPTSLLVSILAVSAYAARRRRSSSATPTSAASAIQPESGVR